MEWGWSGGEVGVEGVPGFGLYLSWDLQLLTLAALHHSRLTHVHQEPVAEARPRVGGGLVACPADEKQMPPLMDGWNRLLALQITN